MSASRKDELPVNTGWFFSNQHNYGPRNVTDEIHRELAKAMVLRDVQLREMVKACPANWYVTVQLGRDTIHLNLYTEEEIHSRQRCAERDLSKMVILSINQNMEVHFASSDLLSTSYPRYYGVRTLTLEEQADMNMMQELFEEHGVESYYAKLQTNVAAMVKILEENTPSHPTFRPGAVLTSGMFALQH